MTTQPEELRTEAAKGTDGPQPDTAARPDAARTDAAGTDTAGMDTGRTDTADTETAARTETSAPGPARRRRRDRWFRYTLPGAWAAVLFACLSFTPSLLPRGPVVQGLVCGITAAIGYGVGVVAAWVWRAFADRDVRPTRRNSWRVFTIVAVVALIVAFLLGQRWQAQIRDLMDVEGGNPAALLLVPVLTAGVFVALVALGRGLRATYWWTARHLGRWIGPRAARAVGWLAVAALTIGLVNGVLLDGLVSAADDAFSVRNGITPEGVQQPTVATRSGGPGSLVAWDTLGREGRKFVGLGPSSADIAKFTGEPARDPIRAYAGLESADSAEQRAALAVDDLQRAGGFDRAYLVVATTTGSGWVDPAAVDTLEYMTGGDSAIVAMQYSYLPSWISYLVDQKRAREAGRELYDAVYSRWSALPQRQRPRLLVFGESLGSFGGEAAFSGEHDLRNRTAGAVFAGPPNFNTLFREFTDHRDQGSREIAPVYRNGRTVRFDDQPGLPIEPASAPWNAPRVLYLQHPSDPIVWWTPRLIMTEPDWQREPPGHDVLGAVVWLPLITFWQVTADLPFATEVPAGHGHTYSTEYVDAWATVLQPADWTDAKAEQLRQIAAAAR